MESLVINTLTLVRLCESFDIVKNISVYHKTFHDFPVTLRKAIEIDIETKQGLFEVLESNFDIIYSKIMERCVKELASDPEISVIVKQFLKGN